MLTTSRAVYAACSSRLLLRSRTVVSAGREGKAVRLCPEQLALTV